MILQWKISPTQILFILLKLNGSVTGARIIPLTSCKKNKKEYWVILEKLKLSFQIPLLMAWKLKEGLSTNI